MDWKNYKKGGKTTTSTPVATTTARNNGGNNGKSFFGDNIGGLYQKKTKNGDICFYGKINGQKVAIFLNKFKTEGDNKPDFQIFADLRPDQNQTATSATAPVRPVVSATPQVINDSEETTDDGLPDF